MGVYIYLLIYKFRWRGLLFPARGEPNVVYVLRCLATREERGLWGKGMVVQ